MHRLFSGSGLLAGILLCQTAVHANVWLPLTPGNTWTLTSPEYGVSMTLRVVSVEDLTPSVRRGRIEWQTPWGFTQTMIVRSSANGIEQEGVQYGSEAYSFPNPLPLFPEGTAGQRWSVDGTTVSLLSTTATVTTNARTYPGVRQYKVTYQDGSSFTWSLVQGGGYVQFGEAPAAFPLSASAVAPEALPVAEVRTPGPCPLTGVDPSSATGQTTDTVLASLKAAGSRFYEFSATWAQLEPSPGRFDVGIINSAIAQAGKYGMTASLTLKTIDTNQRQIPADLMSLPWDDPVMISRFRALMRAIAPALGSRTRWVQLANEVDQYLLPRPGEIAGFRSFFSEGRSELRAFSPGTSVGLVFSWDAVRLSDRAFRELKDGGDHLGFTFYHLTDGSMARPPEEVTVELASLLSRAAGKPVVFTEIGYPSAAGAGSSLEQQRKFYQIMRTELQQASGKVAAVRFFQATDLPSSIVDHFALYYGQSNSAFAAYLGSLGMTTTSGVSKPAWGEYLLMSSQFSSSNGCFSTALQ